MDWSAIGAIGQMLGSLAVFISLGYLAVQLRHVRAEAQRAIIQRRTEGVRENLTAIMTDARLISINMKANADMGVPVSQFATQMTARTSLTADEAYALSLQYWCSWQVYVGQLQNLDELPADERAGVETNIRRSLGANAVGRLWFETTKESLNRSVAARVERILEGGNADR